MLDRVDRVQLAVLDRKIAAGTFAGILGAETISEDGLDRPYNCHRITVQAGDSQFELLEPAGEGLVADHLNRWREGIFAAGFSTSDLPGLTRLLQDEGVQSTQHGAQTFVEPDQTRGMRTVLQATEPRDTVGLITHLYEVTNIVDDHREAATFYARIFGLDQSRFHELTSDMWGYTGTLTLFDPPAHLDRVEITQTTEPKAMGRFYEKHGPSLYMCFVETDDVLPIRERLEKREARFTPTADYPEAGLFIHPTALHGMLMGISATNHAWRWSGRPDLAPQRVRG
jgi:hypothetical protein